LNAGIGINLHYIPVYRHPFYEKKGFKKGYCPEAELYFKETITLPIHPSLNNKEQDYIIHNIRQIIKSN
jgi:dTDP-4-amino-4,6-dideoxygalactose transaminase